MEEACYLDSAHLTAYDLPPGWSMTLGERMGILGPQPTGQPIFYRRTLTPRTALNDRGHDVTHTIAKRDLKAAPKRAATRVIQRSGTSQRRFGPPYDR